MRCSLPPHGDCPTAERCEIEGCRRFLEPNTVAAAREPIELEYQPGKIMRGLMALTDRTERAVKRGPTPFAPATIADRASIPAQEPAAVSATAPPPLPPAPPETVRQVIASVGLPPAPAELRIVAIPGPAWIVYLGDKPLGLVSRIEQLGPPR